MADNTREIPRDTWRAYFDDLSRHLGTVEATVEIQGQDLGPGAHVEAENLILTGISYDDRDDVLVIGLDAPGGTQEDLEHLVSQPQRIILDDAEGDIPSTIDVEDGEGHRTLVQLRPVQ